MRRVLLLVAIVAGSCANASRDAQPASSEAERLGEEFVAYERAESSDETDVDREAVERRRERIVSELEGLDEEDIWGTYFEGDGLGFNFALSIAPESGK